TLRCVTNFYVSPSMANTDHGFNKSSHGKERYKILRKNLLQYSYNLNAVQGMDVLTQVAQGPEESFLSTGFTNAACRRLQR
ncbi:hypothetical protein, partial [uncultured Treponema sp.]|uniref:hypothetical protein n=1 Tax=uncultured Treponema sp. TaxID=162155 RepID=UPI00259708B7